MTVIRRDQAAIAKAQQDRIDAERARLRDEVRQKRAAAFTAQSDPLIGPLMRGEITQEEFRAVAESIRAANPYPDEETS